MRRPHCPQRQRGSLQQGMALPWGLCGALFGYTVLGAWLGQPLLGAFGCGLVALVLGQLLTYEDWGFLLSYLALLPLLTQFLLEPSIQRWVLSGAMALLLAAFAAFVLLRSLQRPPPGA